MKTLIIIPAYNEADNILEVARSVAAAGYDYIIINDGSTDNTLAICKTNDLNVLDLPENLGIGGAVQAGHKYAYTHGYDVDIQFDGDGQHDVHHIPLLVEDITRGNDLIIGSRFLVDTEGFSSSFMRRVGIKWLSFLIKIFTKTRITDPTSGFRACGKRSIELFCKSYPVDYPEPESIVSAIKNGLRVKEISVIMHERQGGSSSIKAFSSIYYMLKVSLAIAIIGFTKKEN